MLRKLLLSVLCLFVFQGMQAQKTFKKANKQFELKAYNLAIANYQKTLSEDDPLNIEAMIRLAEAYRMTNRPIQAVEWYRKTGGAIAHFPEYSLNFAHTLKQMGKYDEAQELYEEFKIQDPVLGAHYALSCDFAKDCLMASESYDLRLFGGNSKYSDFGVSFYNGKVVFSSFRKSLDGIVGDRNDLHIKKNKNHLIYTVSDNPSMRDPLHQLRDALKDDENIGPVSYATDLTRCAYTKNNFKDGFDFVGINDQDMSIYLAEVTTNGDFNDELPFKYNEVGYASGFPCLAFGGTALYYASNKPGGYGGYDLYVSYLKNGDWTYPENLGSQINTGGNEITPFFDGEDLYFSSDYHQGLGGFDVFKSKVLDGRWTFAENMGKGVNSLSDDYFFTVNPVTKDFYLTSNRLGGRGKDDIYLATPIPNDELAVIDELAVPLAVNLEALNSGEAMVPNPAKTVAQVEETRETKTIEIPKAFKLDPSEVPAAILLDKKETDKNIVEAIPTAAEIDAHMVTGVEEVPERVAIADKAQIINDLAEAEYKEQVPEAHKLPEVKTADELPFNQEVSTVSAIEELTIEESTIEKAAKAKANAAWVYGTAEVNYTDAKLIAFDEVITASTNVYFIQVAAIFQDRVNLAPFSKLSKYGNLYKVFKSNSTKIRLGYYSNRSEAESILRNVREIGYSDAFIAHEPLDVHEIQLAVSGDSDIPTDLYASNYKIRLASYQDPLVFDIQSVNDLGKVEQWTKKGWTIFVLSGFRTLEDAESARIKAANRGFSSAELVIDKDGVLERLVQN